MKRSPLKRLSDRRLVETDLYRYRIKRFLLDHPYCQAWLAEHGVSEEIALTQNGVVTLTNGIRVSIPLATEVHHKNKRRGADLLDQTHWLAVSTPYHRQIEENKAWARAQGYLLHF